MKCCICKKEIPKQGRWVKGNNAQPVKDGRCCDRCNFEIVIPERVKLLLKEQEEKKIIKGIK